MCVLLVAPTGPDVQSVAESHAKQAPPAVFRGGAVRKEIHVFRGSEQKWNTEYGVVRGSEPPWNAEYSQICWNHVRDNTCGVNTGAFVEHVTGIVVSAHTVRGIQHAYTLHAHIAANLQGEYPRVPTRAAAQGNA